MDLRQAQQELTAALYPLYGDREAALIADWVMENLTGRRKLDRQVGAPIPLSGILLEKYNSYRRELLAHRPVQYVLRESWFAGMKFYVDENVLIPRPETEELAEWAIATISSSASLISPAAPISPATLRPPGALLDVGTGSGCIPITIANKIPTLPCHACDISTGALQVAARNAAYLKTAVTFHLLDFLDRRCWTTLPPIQWLISNPPYIPLQERLSLPPHVADAEPALALFVPDADPLVFYRALAEFGRARLQPGGAVFVEIHELMAEPVIQLFQSAGASGVEARKDTAGKDRMIKATW